ncbi:uncharacterized protein lgals17 isoform X2 [Electrophorus electricus]|nr:uncharacterized protein lgals17 isoform X2 [Electrophorus electricus]
MGKDSVQGESYENRADVPMEMLAEGNCSLILSDVRFRDAGIYESYLVVGQSRVKNQILIHSVRLAVVDHKHIQSVESGKDLILDLYTNQAKMLVFQQEGTPEWRVLWQRGQDSGGERWVEERGRKLVVREVVTSNSGTYRVVDEEGLTLSTVKVSVTGSVATTGSEVKEKQISLDSGKVDAPSLCLTVVLFLSSHALIHLP